MVGREHMRPVRMLFVDFSGLSAGSANPADSTGGGSLASRRVGTPHSTRSDAFSLVEVVIAVGIVAFSLLAVFAMFGSSLRSASETVSQHEVIGITRSLGEFLGSTNTGVGYAAVSNWVAVPSSAPPVFAFVSSNGTVTVGLSNSIGSEANTLANRTGRLYRIVPTLSTNVPGITNVGNLASNVIIPLNIKIFEVPAVDASTNNLLPVFTYETSVFR